MCSIQPTGCPFCSRSVEPRSRSAAGSRKNTGFCHRPFSKELLSKIVYLTTFVAIWILQEQSWIYVGGDLQKSQCDLPTLMWFTIKLHLFDASSRMSVDVSDMVLTLIWPKYIIITSCSDFDSLNKIPYVFEKDTLFQGTYTIFFLLKWYEHERYSPIDCKNLFIVSKFETFEIVASMSFRGTKSAKVLKKSLQIWWYHQKLKTKKIISPTNIQMKTNLKHKLVVSPHPNLKRGKNCGSAQKFNKSQQICSYHQG